MEISRRSYSNPDPDNSFAPCRRWPGLPERKPCGRQGRIRLFLLPVIHQPGIERIRQGIRRIARRHGFGNGKFNSVGAFRFETVFGGLKCKGFFQPVETVTDVPGGRILYAEDVMDEAVEVLAQIELAVPN